MKQYLYILIILLVGCDHEKDGVQEMTITGKITGKIPQMIEYTIPINGINYFGFKNSVQIDTLGNFQITLPIEKACFIELSNGFTSYATIIAEPGMKYNISINTEEENSKFQIKSYNRKGQELYNQNNNHSMLTGHFELEARKYFKDSIPSEIHQKINESKTTDLAQYQELLETNQISKDFYELVNIDKSYFYAGAETSVAFINYLLSERQQNILNKEEYTRLWESAFKSYPISNQDVMRSPWFFYYVQSYLRYKESVDSNGDLKTLSEIGKERQIHTHNLKMAKTYLSGTELEYYYAAYLYFEAINQNYEKELITLFEEFKIDYPSSEFTHFIESEIIPIINFHKIQDEALSEDIHILDNFENLNTLKQVVNKLNANRVYVDIWATWCTPCKKEFEHNDKLYELLIKEETTMLYVSIDNDKRAEKWMEMMKYYQLEGYHIRANDKLMEDLRRLRGEDTFGIPWHILTDGNGNIIRKYVSGPSDIETLQKQIRN